MFWPNVGRQYLKLFDQVVATREKRLRALYLATVPITSSKRRTAELMQGGL
jgi:hypothetical protein